MRHTSHVSKAIRLDGYINPKKLSFKNAKNRARISEKLSIIENEQRKFKVGQKFSRGPSPRENNFESNL